MRFVIQRIPLLCAIAVLVGAWPAAALPFSEWLEGLRVEAAKSGVSAKTLAALDGLEPDPKVLQLDRNQPSKKRGFCDYLDGRVTGTRISNARQLFDAHGELLEQIEAQYHVPPRYLVALWGLESNFGNNQGGHSVIRALATLAHDPRRAKLFRKQLLAALRILDEGHQSASQMKGSWAGAMGQVQFMPTSFLAYAVDQDGDGRKDIWNSVPDALASAANYLSRSGWKRGQSWGRRVEVPSGLDAEARGASRHPISEWQRRGVTRYGGRVLPVANLTGRVVQPTVQKEPAFLVYPNYETILRWNRSNFFGISVGTLADRITRSGDRVCST